MILENQKIKKIKKKTLKFENSSPSVIRTIHKPQNVMLTSKTTPPRIYVNSTLFFQGFEDRMKQPATQRVQLSCGNTTC